MLIYSNGCSHTEGHGLHITHTNIISDTIFGSSDFNIFKIQPTTQELLSSYGDITKYLKSKSNENTLFQNALAGKGNYLIFMETYTFVTKCIENGINIDYIILQTSGTNRRYKSNWDGTISNITPHDIGGDDLLFEPWGTLETLHWIYILQKLFSKHNIPYVMIPYMELDITACNISPFTNLLDLSRFTENPTKGHRNEFRSHVNYVVDEQGHPSSHGYYHLSQLCIDIIDSSLKLKPIEYYYTDTELTKFVPYKDGKFISYTKERWEFIKRNAYSLGDATLNQIQLLKNNKKDLE